MVHAAYNYATICTSKIAAMPCFLANFNKRFMSDPKTAAINKIASAQETAASRIELAILARFFSL
jgi:hypothetical protein